MNGCNPTVVDVPGSVGQNGFTTITSNFIVPAAGANVTVSVGNSLLLPVGLKVVLVGTAHFQVAQIFSPTSVSLTFLNYPGDVAAGSTISLGAVIAPSDGPTGLNNYTTTLGTITLPLANAQTAPISIGNSAPFIVGEFVAAGDGTSIGTFKVFAKSTGFVTLTWVNAAGDSATGTVIGIGAVLTPIGTPVLVAPVSLAQGGTGQTSALLALAALITSAKTGTFTANGVTPVTVTNTNVTANSVIICSLKTVGGTVGAVPAVKTVTPGSGFTIAGTASDTSLYSYIILN